MENEKNMEMEKRIEALEVKVQELSVELDVSQKQTKKAFRVFLRDFDDIMCNLISTLPKPWEPSK